MDANEKDVALNENDTAFEIEETVGVSVGSTNTSTASSFKPYGKRDNVIMLIAGFLIFLGDAALYACVLLGGFRFFNLPLDIVSIIHYGVNYEQIMDGLLSHTGMTVVILLSMVVTLSYILGLTIRLIIILVRLCKMKVKEEYETTLKKFVGFLKFGGAMYAFCGGAALGFAVLNSELSIWAIVMIVLSFAYIILMLVVEMILHGRAFGTGHTVMRAVGKLILVAIVVVNTMLYVKPMIATVSDFAFYVIPTSFEKDVIIDELFFWVKVFIALIPSSMLSSAIMSFTPSAMMKKSSWGRGTFVFGIILSLVAIGMEIVEMCIFDTTFQVVIAGILNIAPLLLSSIAALITINSLVRLKIEK